MGGAGHMQGGLRSRVDRHLGCLGSGPAGRQTQYIQSPKSQRVLKRENMAGMFRGEVGPLDTQAEEGGGVWNSYPSMAAILFYGTMAAGSIGTIFGHTESSSVFVDTGRCHMVWHRRMRARGAYADTSMLTSLVRSVVYS